jgi:hypothetical protein
MVLSAASGADNYTPPSHAPWYVGPTANNPLTAAASRGQDYFRGLQLRNWRGPTLPNQWRKLGRLARKYADRSESGRQRHHHRKLFQ